MPLCHAKSASPVKLTLARDLVRSIKRGHPWVFAKALTSLPKAPPGSPAHLVDKQGRFVAAGYYHPRHPIAFRVCLTTMKPKLHDDWATTRLHAALRRRLSFTNQRTTGYRLINGEGDGLPGLVADRYDRTVVLSLDGDGPAGFWQVDAMAQWLSQQLDLERVYLRQRRDDDPPLTRVLLGPPPTAPIAFEENGLAFTADIVSGQKTGFFFDQRDNRRRIGELAHGLRVLNLCGYTGGFSIYAGRGGAAHVTTVDTAGPVLQVADQHWQNNGLDPTQHESVQADAFEYTRQQAAAGNAWDLVIVDPPSFAPSEKAVPAALQAYEKLNAAAAKLVVPGGMLASASCSSHIDEPAFLNMLESAVSQARRQARALHVAGQGIDHPWPLVAPELRYLKFVIMTLD